MGKPYNLSQNAELSVNKTQDARMPAGIPYIIGNEAAERFSFYGMKAILTTFLIDRFFIHTAANQQVAEAQANEQTHFFISLAYLMPLIGGFLADRYFGKYKVILYVSIIYCLGHACLAAFDNNLAGFTLGLLLIAIGAGGIKPCVSANVGDQFDENNKYLIPKAFSLFYLSINFGAFFSQILIPQIYGGKPENGALAFGIPGILMALATLIFFLGRNNYRRLPPTGPNPENFLSITAYALRNRSKQQAGQSFIDTAKAAFSSEAVEGVKAVWKVLAVFAFIPVFWALYDQNGSEWVLQARKMDLNVPLFNFTMQAEQVQSINAILILVLTPLFGFWLYPMLEKRGIAVTAMRKLSVGFLLTLLSFVVIAYIQMLIDAGQQPNVVWQFLAYFILTAGEVLISITGLEYAYTQAPPSMKSTLMSFWLLTVASGNFIVSKINNNIEHGGMLANMLNGANYYWFFIALIGINTVLYFLMLRNQKSEKHFGGFELFFAGIFVVLSAIVIVTSSIAVVQDIGKIISEFV